MQRQVYPHLKERLLSFVAIYFLSLCFSGIVCADITGKVIGITDGDTITVLIDEATDKPTPIKVRLAQIDAPEKKQAFGRASKKHLSDLLFGKQVIVIGSHQDHYFRLIGTVFVDDTNANIEQLKAGMAWVYIRYLRDPELLDNQDYAQKAQIGLWQDDHPIPPWQFRKQRRQ